MACLDPGIKSRIFLEELKAYFDEKITHAQEHVPWAEAFIDFDETSSTQAIFDEADSNDDESLVDLLNDFDLKGLKIPCVIDCHDFGRYYDYTYIDGVFSKLKPLLSIPPAWMVEYKISIINAFHSARRFTDLILNTFAMPKDLGLINLAARYKSKYDIDIYVAGCASKANTIILDALDKKTAHIFGMICSNREYEICHVTPVLILVKEDGNLQIVNLDSTKTPVDSFARMLNCLKIKKINYTRFSLKGPRQADRFSCRSDAIILLKDALRDLKEKTVKDFCEFFTGRELIERRIYVDFPVQWSRVCQISKILTGSLEEKLVGKKDTTASLFKDRFSVLSQKVDTYELIGIDEKGAPKKLTIEIQTEAKVNLYLNYKGKKNFETLKMFLSDLKQKDIEWIRMLESKY